MAGRGRPPKPAENRVTRHVPTRGEPTALPFSGWQHGDVPVPPDGLKDASVEAWRIWFAAWFAAHWTLADVPALRHLIGLYDQVERGEFQRHGELRLAMDTFGITPKGQQDRRWEKPKPAEPATGADPRPASRERRLRAV